MHISIAEPNPPGAVGSLKQKAAGAVQYWWQEQTAGALKIGLIDLFALSRPDDKQPAFGIEFNTFLLLKCQ
jgi:hypothetical protein